MNHNRIALSLFGIMLLAICGILLWGFMIVSQGSIALASVEPYIQPTLEEEYDVIVVGGDPEGVAAAVSAARNGSKTLLIEHRDGLGGLFTFGALNFLDVSKDMNGKEANTGIFREWHRLVDFQHGFDIKKAGLAFMKLVQDEENLTLALDTKVVSAVKDGKRLSAVEVIDYEGKPHTIKAASFVDSTQDGDLAVLAGAPFFKGGADIGLEDRKMAVTLVLHFKNVDWELVRKAGAENVFGGGHVTNNVAWGFNDLHYEYKPQFENTRLRGLNIVRQEDGSVYVNALQIFGIDGLDEEARKKAYEIGREEADHILAFLQKEFPGFENAELAVLPEELYVRETRHIKAEYQIPMSDVWENRDHWDSIGFGAYPVDVQATSPGDYGYVISDPIQFAIPFRSLIPLEVDGLLIASKAAGYGSIAAGSARVVPTGMTLGQAAGVASSLAIENGISFREMSKDKELISALQEKLKKQGMNLYAFDLPFPYEKDWFYPAVKLLLNYGLVVGGYDNILPVDKPMTELGFANLLAGLKRIVPGDTYDQKLNEVRYLIPEDTRPTTRNRAAEMMLYVYGVKAVGDEAWRELEKRGLLDSVIREKLPEDRELTTKETYYLAHLLKDIGKIED